jgi:hypothetical protein
LKVKKGRVLETDRAEYVTPTTLDAFFNKLEGLFETGGYSRSMIANFDETMIQVHTRSVSVIGPTASKDLYIQQSREMPHMTMGVCVFADGSHAKHLLILNLLTLPPELDQDFWELHPATAICGQRKGWIDKDILASHFRAAVLPHFMKQRETQGSSYRGLLLLDAHASRINEKLWQEFADNDIDVMTFVSHASHVQQPLDLVIFSVFKAEMSRGNSALRQLQLADKRFHLIEKSLNSIHVALTPRNVASAFARAGIYPLDRSVPKSHPAVNNDPNAQQTPSRKRRTVIRLDGDVLTANETIQRLRTSTAGSRTKQARSGANTRKRAKSVAAVTPYDEEDTDTAEEDDETDEEVWSDED